jgi:hypothetical protein
MPDWRKIRQRELDGAIGTVYPFIEVPRILFDLGQAIGYVLCNDKGREPNWISDVARGFPAANATDEERAAYVKGVFARFGVMAGLAIVFHVIMNSGGGPRPRGSAPVTEKPACPPANAPRPTPPRVPATAAESPGPGWEWRGQQPVGGERGAWYRPATGETLHPDLNHPAPVGPHWDWRAPDGTFWRIFPDGTVVPRP